MFSPFPNFKISGLTAEDLNTLISEGVAEGQFVEYKRTLVKPSKIANSIASFANSYGGWYIVGVEADKVRNCPLSIDGLTHQDSPDPASSIRDAIRHHLSPTPVFYTEVISLAGGHTVAVVCIPDRQEKPIISRDGRIYRRVADSSEPTFEHERHAIDRLVDEGRDYSKRFEDFCKDDRTCCRGESEDPWLHIYFRPSPDWVERPSVIKAEDLQALLSQCKEPVSVILASDVSASASIPFDVIGSGPGYTILGSVTGRPRHLNPLSIELHDNGWARLRIPLPFEELHHALQHSSHEWQSSVQITMQELAQADVPAKVLNSVATMHLIITLIGVYTKWLGETPAHTGFRYRIVVENAWRLLPFFDDAEWVKFVSKCGIHLGSKETVTIPSIAMPPSYFDPNSTVSLNMWIAIQTTLALGLPIDVALHCFGEDLQRNAAC